MQACVDVAFPYAHMRDAFGKKIGEHQVYISFISLPFILMFIFKILFYTAV